MAGRAGRATMLASIMVLSHATAHATGPCDTLLPGETRGGVRRLVSADDLLRLRGFGRSPGSAADENPLSLSPDGTRVAFLLRQAVPEHNMYCQGVVVLDLASRRAKLVDKGGELIRYRFDDLRGLVVPTGTEAIVVPRWSPNGSRLAYLQRVRGRTTIRLVAPDGSMPPSTIRLDDGVEAVDWASATTLVLQVRPGLTRAEKAITHEGDGGHLYDDRFVPMAASRPFARGPVPPEVRVFDLVKRRQQNADAHAREILTPEAAPLRPRNAQLFAQARDNRIVWTTAREPDRYKSASDLWVRDRSGSPIRCDHDACSSLEAIWWQGKTLILQRREGWARSLTALYRWTPGGGPPRWILQTPDLLLGCQVRGKSLLCGREGSTQPRRIVAIDLSDGHETLVYDPNLEFRSRILGTVERLHWRNERGVESFGDLILPPDHQPGQRHPLIVVQYRTRGFLRGGTGDEYPIQAFAARGFAVLSFDRPPPLADEKPDPAWKTFLDAEPTNLADWIDRRNVLSTLLKGIDLLVARGLVDPARIGLTGMSDGVTTAQFALVNSKVFAAAALSTCCEDPKTEMLVGGEAFAREFRARTYPQWSDEAPAFWRPFSIAVNAASIRTPILMQLADDEYAMGLETYTALKEHGRPVEMYVFPDEHHVKWQPRHRAAIYERNLDWFDFWLRGRIDHAPAKAAQYARWQAMRAAPGASAGTAHADR